MEFIDSMKRILVIGATGNIGRQLVAQLVRTGAPVRAMTRKPDEARMPAQVEVVGGDLTLPDTLKQCLVKVDSVFLVWTAPQEAAEAALEVIVKYTRRLVFLSAPLKTLHPFFQQPNRSRAMAMHLEQLIESSGLEWTILRPGMFALNARHFWGPQIRAGNLVRWPYLTAPTAPIDERDIARVAVRVLSEEHHGGMDYVLTGPQSLTQYEQVSMIGAVMGRPLHIEEITPEEAQRTCLAEMPPAVRSKLLDAWAAAVGLPAFVTSTVEDLTGIPARTFRDWVEDNVSEFRA
jgi:uncharacterized protein YbjT (DUF2867 family)